MKPKLRVRSFINAVLPTAALLVGQGRGTIELQVRFLVVERPDGGIVLVDGGFGPAISALKGLKAALYRRLIRVPRQVVTPAMALAHLGRDPREITDVVLTHLHADHVCNLDIVPETAKLHLSRRAAEILTAHHGHGSRRPLTSGDFPELVPASLAARATPVEDFPPVRIAGAGRKDLAGHDLLGDGSILAVALPGHAAGHLGLAFPAVSGLKRPLLYAADTSWTYEGLASDEEPPAGRLIGDDAAAARGSRKIMSEHLAAGHSVLLCHDDRRQKIDIALPELD